VNITQTCIRGTHVNCCIFGVKNRCEYRNEDEHSKNGLVNGGIHKYAPYKRVKQVIADYKRERNEQLLKATLNGKTLKPRRDPMVGLRKAGNLAGSADVSGEQSSAAHESGAHYLVVGRGKD
jgi:hypothetical protein